MKNLVNVKRGDGRLRLQVGIPEGENVAKIIFYISEGPHVGYYKELVWEITGRPDGFISAAGNVPERGEFQTECFNILDTPFYGELRDIPGRPQMVRMMFCAVRDFRTSTIVFITLRRTELKKLEEAIDDLTSLSPLGLADRLVKQWLRSSVWEKATIIDKLLRLLNGPHGDGFAADFRDNIVADYLDREDGCYTLLELANGHLLEVYCTYGSFIANEVRVVLRCEAKARMKELSEMHDEIIRKALSESPEDLLGSIFLQFDEDDDEWDD